LFCKEWPFIDVECEIFVTLYTPELLKWLATGETPKAFCTSVGLCTASTKSAKIGVEK